MRRRDVMVVGGGPAGSVTALLLARAGFDVELIERQQFPRAKPCGDCLSPGANAVLQRLNLWQTILAARPAQLHGWSLWCAAGSGFESGFEQTGSERPVSLAMPRERFDALLLGAAQAAGVQVRTDCRVTDLLRNDDGAVSGVRAESLNQHSDIGARLVVGADGLRSRVARLLHAHARPPRIRKLSLTVHVRGVRCRNDFGEMHVYRDACLGIARVESGPDPLYNVTVVLRADRKRSQGAHHMLRAALRAFGRADIADLVSDAEVVLASGPFDWPVRRVAFDGVLLVGDAAGYFDPFTGQGMFQALAGAELVAKHASAALLQCRTTAGALHGYARDHHALYAGTRRVQRAIDFICTQPRLTDLVFRAFGKSPRLARRLVTVTADLRPARTLLWPVN